ncbi:molybdenum cofactor synthesis protein 2 large subunit [Cavenderia fasciculata]|uniref:Molybdenum cofactor synthesis protein 2 large subunit n=1 Tax=Cavenderia fasciculata TaxID=261658 RepID=F4Q0B1_CACFS|nr:molybdenum cofactor synthesis protein 2 large subunit [Cavenderia fasciculata]EGG18262.1 molybdenum cofactor synthesis protein 2 large subunit [Cavenderia fasciculata]|eukprot:XP_004357085.1 molybdenum cofactor synthesis protein 2 large subunit [Cavenderia fasciculata]
MTIINKIIDNDRNVYIEITNEKIDLMKYIDMVGDEKAGAISTFIGTTRDNFKGKQVLYLEYEAYIPMALKEIEKIINHLYQNFNIQNCSIIHNIITT